MPVLDNGRKSDNPDTWTSYTVAKRAYEHSQHTARPYDGLGYMFERDITGIDLDHCIDADGQIAPWAQAMMHLLASYAERSPGDGIHIYVRGTIPKGIRRAIQPGIASSTKMRRSRCTVRGATLLSQGRMSRVLRWHRAEQNALDALYAELTEQVVTINAGENDNEYASANFLDADALLKKAVEARNGEKFRALFYEGARGYPSASEADMALCLLLAFWTGRDKSRMDCLYRKTALYREKWDSKRSESTYGWETIHKAADLCSIVYDPRRTHRQLSSTSNRYSSRSPSTRPG